MNCIYLGDCLDVLKTLPDSSVDSIVTDPPYGLGTKEPTVPEIIAYLQGADLDTGGDFMGRDWSVPSVQVWKECFRVLKPGSHLLSFGGTRTFDLISIGLRAAGFESRDTVASQFGVQTLQWCYGQGFPKSMNVSKAIDAHLLHGGSSSLHIKDANAGRPGERRERGQANNGGIVGTGGYTRDPIKDQPSTGKAEEWLGWGTSLKPSWEPILVFRKPLEGTVAQNVLKHGTGGINVDANRIGTSEARPKVVREDHECSSVVYSGGKTRGALGSRAIGTTMQGRWPSNFLLVHADACKKVGTKKVKAPVINRFSDGMKPFGEGAGHSFTSEQQGDAEGMEEIPVYECGEGCPVKLLDNQSGDLSSTSKPSVKKAAAGKSSPSMENPDSRPAGTAMTAYGGVGGASRYFGHFEPEAPFFYCGKVSKKERFEWAEGEEVPAHPTVKPLSLMRWLVKLVTPKGAVVLDPYCGSGSTCVAAIQTDCHYIGIERDPEFHTLATKRCAAYAKAQEESQPVDLEALMADLEQA